MSFPDRNGEGPATPALGGMLISAAEAYGRKWPVVGPCLVAGIFSLWTGAARDMATVIVTRFFTGLFGSAPVSNTGGVLADIWPPTQRGYAIMVYSMAVSIGPTLGPVIGNAITQAGVDWRWLQYVSQVEHASGGPAQGRSRSRC